MTTALEKKVDLTPVDFSDGAREMFRKLIAPGAPDDQVALVYHYAKALGLDPLRRQVMLISFKKKDGDRWIESYVIIVGVHGMLAKCTRHVEWGGVLSGVVYPGEDCKIAADGTVTHVQDILSRGASRPGDDLAKRSFPLGAWATSIRVLHGAAIRHTVWLPFAQAVQTVRIDEWVDGKKTGRKVVRLRDVWDKYPDWMIEKSAISFALRKGFDDVLAGFYSAEEFGGRSNADGSLDVDPTQIADAVLIDDADATPTIAVEPGQSPASQAGAIPGSETVKQEVITGLSDPRPEPGMAELALGGPPPMTRDEKLLDLFKTGKYAEHACGGRPFIVEQSPLHHWLIDAAVLGQIDRHSSQLVEDMDDEQVAKVKTAINVEIDSANARGRR